MFGGASKFTANGDLPVSNRVNIIAQSAINVAMLSMIKTLQLLKKETTVVARERTQGQVEISLTLILSIPLSPLSPNHFYTAHSLTHSLRSHCTLTNLLLSHIRYSLSVHGH